MDKIIKVSMKVVWVRDYRDDEREYFNKLSVKEKEIWERGVDYAVKRIKDLSWKERLLKRFI